MAFDTAATIGQDVSFTTHALDRKLVRGITWTGGIKGATLFLSWASWVIVARILDPADYGLVAMATVYLGITAMFTDFGLSNAIVALRDLDRDVTRQLHTLAVMAGGAAFVVSCLLAVPLSRFFGTPGLVAVVIALSTALVIDSLRVVPTALLARELRFKDLALIDGFKILIGVGFTLTLAWSGAQYWALVLGNILGSLAITLVVLVKLPQRFAWPKFRELKSTLTFSSHFLTGQLALYGYMNSDFVIAGRVLGSIALGQYTLAWNLISAPAEKVLAVFGRVMPTMLAAVQRDPTKLRRYFFLYTEALAILVIPAAIGLSLVAPDFVLLVFGAKWAAAVIPAQLLCLYTAIHIPAIPMMPLLQVTGQAWFPPRWCFATLAILLPLFYLAGTRFGTIGIAAVWVLVYPMLLVPVYRRVFRTLDISVREYVENSLGATLAAVIVMAAAVLAIRALLPSSLSLAARFSAQTIGGALVFAIAGFSFYRKRLGALSEFMRNLRS